MNGARSARAGIVLALAVSGAMVGAEQQTPTVTDAPWSYVLVSNGCPPYSESAERCQVDRVKILWTPRP